MAKKESTPTICVTLKLRPTCAQEATFRRWLWHLSGVYNWAVKTIEREAGRGVYLSKYDLQARLNGHSKRLGIPARVLDGTAVVAHTAWTRCFAGLSGRPRLKARRRPLNSIAFAGNVLAPVRGRRFTLLGIGPVRFHAQDIPDGHISGSRIVRRASGWHLCLFIKANPQQIDRVSAGQAGIDPGFSTLLTLSTGEKIEHPHELAAEATRLAQAQRGSRKRLTARLQERIGTRRKDRNHKLSRSLVARFDRIAFSVDRNLARAHFSKSVTSASHYQLRSMLRYKSLLGGTEYIEVPSRNSTRTCSACGALSGPTGWLGLKVRQWVCGACGAPHDRDVNAATNTLIAGLGRSHKSSREAVSGIAS